MSNEFFVSYAREDLDFVQSIVDGLKEKKTIDLWFDLDDLRPSTEWEPAILISVQTSHDFIFVISPDSVKSEPCAEELRHALLHNKRLIPILYRDTDTDLIHPALRKIQWLFFKDFNRSIDLLANILEAKWGISLGDRVDSSLKVQTLGELERPPFYLYRNSYVLGRAPQAKIATTGIIKIKDPFVSRNHAELRLQEGRWKIKDLDSSNGLKVNDIDVSGFRALRHRDIIQFSAKSIAIYEELIPSDYEIPTDTKDTITGI